MTTSTSHKINDTCKAYNVTVEFIALTFITRSFLSIRLMFASSMDLSTVSINDSYSLKIIYVDLRSLHHVVREID